MRKRCHLPATPFQRLLADTRTPQGVRDEVNALLATLDPILLLRDMRRAQKRLVDLAQKTGSAPVHVLSIEEFLAGLRTAWKEGEVRPTAKPAAKPKRGRRRPEARRVIRGRGPAQSRRMGSEELRWSRRIGQVAKVYSTERGRDTQ